MMLTVIGGAYQEVCLQPEWNQLYGSGLRGAISISEIAESEKKEPIRLITWASDIEVEEIKARCESFEIDVDINKRDDFISYQYDHGLSKPRMYPGIGTVRPILEYKCDLDNALMYGVIEECLNAGMKKRIKIKARKVVYDPQAGEDSLPWSQTGSVGDKVALLLNMNEAMTVAKKLLIDVAGLNNKPRQLGLLIREKENVDVVVIKHGALGAFVLTDNMQEHVSSYKTNHVFPIGTGDVFSAVFSIYWAECGFDALAAAKKASAAVAYYCNSKGALPVPSGDAELMRGLVQHNAGNYTGEDSVSAVYIAGPLFTLPQRWLIEEVRRCFHESGVKTFSPLHDVGTVGHENEIADADIRGLESCAAIFAIVDGLDAGTMFEVGYASAKGIPVYAFGELQENRNLLMVKGHDNCQLHTDLPTAIYMAAWTALEK